MKAHALPSVMFLRVAQLLCVLGAAAPAAAAETSLRLFIPTDLQGDTRELRLTPADGTFTAFTPGDGSIRIQFSDLSFTNRWSLGFAAAHAQPLAAGPYYDAGPYPFQPDDQNGIRVDGTDFYGLSRNETGSFEVKQVAYGTGTNLASATPVHAAQ